jgi:hypothetical protein
MVHPFRTKVSGMSPDGTVRYVPACTPIAKRWEGEGQTLTDFPLTLPLLRSGPLPQGEGLLNDYSPNTNTIVAFLARPFISGDRVSLPTWLRVRPVAIAIYCLPSTA